MCSVDQSINTTTICRELRQHLRSDIVQLVRRNRLNVLKRGQVFPKVGKSKGVQQKGIWVTVDLEYVNLGQQQYWFWRLDANEKMLCYMNCDENETNAFNEKSSHLHKSKTIWVSWN
jgi:hypothetical protein